MLASTFVVPALDMLAGRCCEVAVPSELEDALLRGRVWVLAGMWRLHSGGGALVPGGIDHCEGAAQLQAECQRRLIAVRRELDGRALEELAVDGEGAPGGSQCGGGVGAAADLVEEANGWRREDRDLGQFCRLRPPLLINEATPAAALVSLPAVAAVVGGSAASYQELCQEVAAFASSVAHSERVLRLVGLQSIAVGTSGSAAELQNLTVAALGFTKRLQARFPLHTDLVAPVSLAVHGLLHGLHLANRQDAWLEDTTSMDDTVHHRDIGAVPQAPAYEVQSPCGVLRDETAESSPEVACWWLRWAAVLRLQEPKPLLAPRPFAAMRMLEVLSKRHFDEEQKKAQEEVQGESLFKMAKAAFEAAPDEKEAEEEAERTLFPGSDQVEITRFLGLGDENNGGVDANGDPMDTAASGGGSLYDVFGNTSIDKPAKKKTTATIGEVSEQRCLTDRQLIDLCDLSLLAFWHQAKGSSGDGTSPASDAASITETADAAREEALDMSLELFIRRHVASVGDDPRGDSGRTKLLPPEVASRLSPLVLLRLRRAANELRTDQAALVIDSSAVKRRASQAKPDRLHREAACAFYAESNPTVLLQLARPLSALLGRTRQLLERFDAHPSLLALEGIIEKVLQLRLLQTTPMAMVTMVELLLGRAAVWEEAACREVSIAHELRPLQVLIVSLRERQLLEWRELREARERHQQRQGAKWWLHVIGILADASDPRKLVDELMRFLRISPVAQFRLRLKMLRAGAHLHLEAEGEASVAGRVAMHVCRYASKWLPITDKVLTKKREIMEKEVRDLVKIVRWDLSNYHALKDSVTRSHRQIAKVIKRFDDALQEIIDPIIASASSAPEMIQPSAGPATGIGALRSISGFLLADREVHALDHLLAACGVASGAVGCGDGERFSDNEEFWSNPARVVAASPRMLRGLVRVVSTHVLPDTFCFGAPEGHRTLECGESLCDEIASALVALQDEEQGTQMKRRRLQGLRDELARYGLVPRPLAPDAFDVTDFFSSVVRIAAGSVTTMAEAEEAPFVMTGSDSAEESTSVTQKEGDGSETSMPPPPKRMRCGESQQASAQIDKSVGDRATHRPSVLSDEESMWSRTEVLSYDLVHLALRLHSLRDKPSDLTSGDVNLWLGLSVACIRAVRSHRERCADFDGALRDLTAIVGASLQGPSEAVNRGLLRDVFVGLDRLLEGGRQARLLIVASEGTIDPRQGKQSALVTGLDGAMAAVGSALQLVQESDEFRVHFPVDEGEAESSRSELVRVRTSFLRSLVEKFEHALALLVGSLREGGKGEVAATTRANLLLLADALRAKLESLRPVDRADGNTSDDTSGALPSSASWRTLRSLLVASQLALDGMKSDASICVSAATPKKEETEQVSTTEEQRLKPTGAEAEWDEEGPVPKLGIGKGHEIQSLLQVLPLGQMRNKIVEYVAELPARSLEPPIAPFAKQTVQLGNALLLCGLEANVATLEVSVALLRFVTHLLEKGLGSKTEEEEGGAGDSRDEWNAGTGMGEGEGLRDVTEEIQDDQQLDGLQTEKQEEPKEQPEQPKDGEEDKAREMGFDFDAENKNVEQKEPNEEQDEKDKEAEDDLDRKAGEVDLNEGGKLEDKLWNGDEDEDDKDNNEKDDSKQQKEEDIEAHGAKGEGEADQVANEDTKEESKEKEDPSKQKDANEKGGDEKDAADEQKDKVEPEDATVPETEFDAEKDAQFDVHMQPDKSNQQGDEADGEGEGEGEGEEDGIPEDGDLNLDGDEGEASGEEGKDDGSAGGETENEVDDSVVPNLTQEGEEEQKDNPDQGVDPCIQGEGAEEQEQPEEKEQERADTPQPQNLGKKDKPEESSKGDPASAPGNDTAPQTSPQTDEQLLGGTKGESTRFESSAAEQSSGADAESGRDQSGVAPTSGAQDAAKEMPTDKPQQQKPGPGGQKPPTAQPSEQDVKGDDGESERRLQKVDVLRDADEGDVTAGKEQQEGAEKGLHLADPKSGVDALGECRDPASAPDQAMGVVEQDGDDDDDGNAMAQDDEEKPKSPGEDQEHGRTKEMSGMALQSKDDDEQQRRSAAEGDGTKQDDPMEIDGTAGSSEIVNVAKADMPLLRVAGPEEAMRAAESSEIADVAVGPNPARRSEREARQLWAWLEGSTAALSAALCEQLRTILEPTLKGRLQGHYRTGKRISMRRVIPFIASNYRRDKIWLRRTKPSKREYQVLVGIDNSRSMQECGVGPMALQTLTVVCRALAQLEVGEYGVMAFGSDTPRVLLPLGAGQLHAASFGWEQAGPLLTEFTFAEESAQSHNRSLADMMQLGSRLFDERSGSAPSRPFSQVLLIVSDGRFNKAKVKPWVQMALSRQQLPLLIIVDGLANTGAAAAVVKSTAVGPRSSSRSVFDLKAVTYEGGQCNVVPYLQDFPFPYYVVVQDLRALPEILSDVLKQWFELAVSG
eukprot:TRINITY_DN40248_c0_g1_i1.p1 TRINITY_DN40248_c0_g1~~TRINITY_DN40248_c0_g1_i1.p1  ORF type:complete len:2544 (+),score=680.20 TRINITY_DN40248_c0_g1_i1:328-7632(+)